MPSVPFYPGHIMCLALLGTWMQHGSRQVSPSAGRSLASSRLGDLFPLGDPGHFYAQFPMLTCSTPIADASFVAAIPSTDVVYFFFEESASEFEFFEKLHTSRVARVCKVLAPSGWEVGPAMGGEVEMPL